MSVHRFEELTRDELNALAPHALLILPVASTEQHGPHLPAVTDTALVGAVLDRASVSLPPDLNVLRAPTVCYGASDHHLIFGGTLSLTTHTLRLVLTELVRSASRVGCTRVLLVNGHGGNASTCSTVAADSSREEEILVASCSYWDLADGPDGSPIAAGHAGRVETSLMLVARPDLVHLDRARASPGTVRSYGRGLNVRQADSWERIDGFTDDARASTKDYGDLLISRLGEALATAITEIAHA